MRSCWGDIRPMDKIYLVLTSLPDQAGAELVARALIESRAAACVNILSGCTSVYPWQGEIKTTHEVPLLIKTTRAAYARLESVIRAHHPYELPEIIAVPVDVGLPGYLEWVTQTASPIADHF